MKNGTRRGPSGSTAATMLAGGTLAAASTGFAAGCKTNVGDGAAFDVVACEADFVAVGRGDTSVMTTTGGRSLSFKTRGVRLGSSGVSTVLTNSSAK